jgi:hypothetical protein
MRDAELGKTSCALEEILDSGINYDPDKIVWFNPEKREGKCKAILEISHEALNRYGFYGVKWNDEVTLTHYIDDPLREVHRFVLTSPNFPVVPEGLEIPCTNLTDVATLDDECELTSVLPVLKAPQWLPDTTVPKAPDYTNVPWSGTITTTGSGGWYTNVGATTTWDDNMANIKWSQTFATTNINSSLGSLTATTA